MCVCVCTWQRRRAEYEALAASLLQEVQSVTTRLYNTQLSLVDEDETRPGGLLQPSVRRRALSAVFVLLLLPCGVGA